MGESLYNPGMEISISMTQKPSKNKEIIFIGLNVIKDNEKMEIFVVISQTDILKESKI